MSDDTDYLWRVVKPRNGEVDAIERMNTMLLAFDPNSPARDDVGLRDVARSLMGTEDVSFAHLVQSGIEI